MIAATSDFLPILMELNVALLTPNTEYIYSSRFCYNVLTVVKSTCTPSYHIIAVTNPILPILMLQMVFIQNTEYIQ